MAAGRAKVDQIEDQRLRAKEEAKLRLVEYAFQRLDFIVKNVVAEVAQTSDKQTCLTPDEKRQRLNLALEGVKQQVPRDLEETLKGVVNDFNRYLTTKIEAARFEQKQAKPVSPVVLRLPAEAVKSLRVNPAGGCQAGPQAVYAAANECRNVLSLIRLFGERADLRHDRIQPRIRDDRDVVPKGCG